MMGWDMIWERVGRWRDSKAFRARMPVGNYFTFSLFYSVRSINAIPHIFLSTPFSRHESHLQHRSSEFLFSTNSFQSLPQWEPTKPKFTYCIALFFHEGKKIKVRVSSCSRAK